MFLHMSEETVTWCSGKAAESKVSKFTLTSDDNDGPVLRENNAYLNDNVD